MNDTERIQPRSTLRTILGPVVGIITLVICGWVLYRTLDGQWDQLRQVAFTPAVIGAGIVASGIHATANHVLAAQWGRMLNALGAHLPRQTVAWLWTRAQLTRYAIGSAGLVSRPVLAKAYGVPLTVGTSTTLLESAWLMAILGLGLPTAGAQHDVLGPLVWMAGVGCAVLVLGLTLKPSLVLSPLRWLRPDLVTQGLDAHGLIITGGYLAQIGLRAGAFVALGIATAPRAAANWPLFIGAFAVSYLVGWLFIFSPGGLGPREAVAGVMLTQAGLAPGEVVALVTIARVVEVVGELAYVGLVTNGHRHVSASADTPPEPVATDPN